MYNFISSNLEVGPFLICHWERSLEGHLKVKKGQKRLKDKNLLFIHNTSID